MSTVRATNFQNAGSASVNMTLDTAGNATVANTLAMGSSFLRNRIINGDMRIDQRNVGASVTGNSGAVAVDRWFIDATQTSKMTIQQNAGSVTPPAGFKNYYGVTSSSSYSVLSGDNFAVRQWIEGYNISDLNFGTSSAVTVTLSFWVRSSLTGTFGGSLVGYNGSTFRSCPFSYSISSANTWEQKSVTLTGDTTTFSYNSTNGYGLMVGFSMGSGSTYSATAGVWTSGLYYSATGSTSVVGTNAATWYVTGVQLEVGTAATPFERRQFGQELALCQRYFAKTYPINTAIGTANALGAMTVPCFGSMAYAGGNWWFPVTMRANPTITVYSAYTGTVNKVSADAVDGNGAAASIGDRSCSIFRNNDSTGVAVNVFITAHATANAEL